MASASLGERAQGRLDPFWCPACEYDLAGVRAWRCPECGRSLSGASSLWPRSAMPPSTGVFGRAGAVLILASLDFVATVVYLAVVAIGVALLARATTLGAAVYVSVVSLVYLLILVGLGISLGRSEAYEARRVYTAGRKTAWAFMSIGLAVAPYPVLFLILLIVL